MKRPLILVLFISSFLTACGAYQSGRLSQNGGIPANELTGFERTRLDTKTGKRVVQVFTRSGDNELYNEIADELKNESPLFAQAIVKINLRLQKNENDPERFFVKMKFNPDNYYGLQALDFEVPLRKNGADIYGSAQQNKKTPESFSSQFIIKLDCKDAECRRVKLIISEQSEQRRVRAGLIYTIREADISIQRAQASGNKRTSPSIEAASNKLTKARAQQSSVIVIQGPSYSEVQVFAENEVEPVIDITTELLDTTESDSDVQELLISGSDSKNVAARLSGNDPTTGGLIIDLDDRTTGDGMRLIVQPEFSAKTGNKDEVIGQFELQMDPAKALLVPSKNLNTNSNAYRMTEQLNAYGNNPEVIHRALMWGGAEAAAPACVKCRMPYPSRMKAFIYNAKLVEDIISENLLKADVTPETAYIMLIESEFLTLDSHPIQVPSTTSAVGPWQLLNGTATWVSNLAKLGMSITKISETGKTNRPVDASDARTKLSTASLIAGHYLSLLRGYFPHDIGLMYLAYYRGQGKVRQFMKKTCGLIDDSTEEAQADFTKNHCKYAVTLDQISQFNMTLDEHTDYAYTAIAMRFVGRNPKAYGMELPTAGTAIPKALKEKL